ncbi:MAG: hypothetical protein DMF77_06765 [Acidobacteria bacterium]|nr:MAG: hypothetical protein DMF77_06765 [Acidobacteriota bacterium]
MISRIVSSDARCRSAICPCRAEIWICSCSMSLLAAIAGSGAASAHRIRITRRSTATSSIEPDAARKDINPIG